MVTPTVTPAVTLSTTPMVDSAVEVPLPPARGQPCLATRRARTFQLDDSACPAWLVWLSPARRLLTGTLTYLLTGVRGEGRKKRPRHKCLPWMRELFPLDLPI